MPPIPYTFILGEDEANTFAFQTVYQLTYEVRFKNTGNMFTGYPNIEPNTFDLKHTTVLYQAKTLKHTLKIN